MPVDLLWDDILFDLNKCIFAYNATDFKSFELLCRSNVLIYLDVMYKCLERHKVQLHFMQWNFFCWYKLSLSSLAT